jgi:hypothetical protein
VAKEEALLQNAKSVTLVCAFWGVLRSITPRQDSIRRGRDEGWTYTKHITTKKVCTLHFNVFK